MTWQQTVIVGLLVAGAVVAGALHLEQLAGVLAGAAAGIVAPTMRPPSGPTQAQLATAAPVALALVGGGLAVVIGASP